MDLYVPREKTLTEKSPGLKQGKLQSETRKSIWFFLSKENSTGHTWTCVQCNRVDVEEVTLVRTTDRPSFCFIDSVLHAPESILGPKAETCLCTSVSTQMSSSAGLWPSLTIVSLRHFNPLTSKSISVVSLKPVAYSSWVVFTGRSLGWTLRVKPFQPVSLKGGAKGVGC